MAAGRLCCALASAFCLSLTPPAGAETSLRIAMTASDVPTTTGMPNDGFEGMRFLGYPSFEGLVLWDLTHADRLATLKGAMALNVSSPSSDVGIMARYFSSANFSPNGFNFEQWKDVQFDAALATLAAATDEATILASFRTAHERLVDNPPWLFIVHDLNPRAMSKKVTGFVSAQSWFLDLTLVGMEKQ
jgi:hypothetical protein